MEKEKLRRHLDAILGRVRIHLKLLAIRLHSQIPYGNVMVSPGHRKYRIIMRTPLD